MTTVRIVQAEPRPGWMPDGSVLVGRHLVVLADDTGHRAVPLWLPVPGGKGLWHLLDRPADDAAMAGVLEETAARLLRAAGVRVIAVDIEPTREDVTELRSDTVAARLGLATPAGTRQVLVSAGYGLALAAATGAPVGVPDQLMDRLAVPVRGEDLLAPLLPPVPPRPAGHPGQRWRFEPRNLAFTNGLDRWELAGSFLAVGPPHGQDYSATNADGSAVLRSAVAEPAGFAVLVQTIYADDYRGAAVTFRGELRATDVAGRAGLHLAAGRPEEPPGAHLRNRGASSQTGPGSSDWTGHEVALVVPGEAGVVRLGISLTGPGRVELRNAEFTAARPETRG